VCSNQENRGFCVFPGFAHFGPAEGPVNSEFAEGKPSYLLGFLGYCVYASMCMCMCMRTRTCTCTLNSTLISHIACIEFNTRLRFHSEPRLPASPLTPGTGSWLPEAFGALNLKRPLPSLKFEEIELVFSNKHEYPWQLELVELPYLPSLDNR
jgi:hypothetical protein